MTTALIDRPASGSAGAIPARDRSDALLVVEDHPVVLGGVRSLAGQAGFESVLRLA